MVLKREGVSPAGSYGLRIGKDGKKNNESSGCVQ